MSSDKFINSTGLEHFATKIKDRIDPIQTHINNISYESGEMSDADSVAWYTAAQGLQGKTMVAKYNLIGDFCILSITDMHLCDGWWDMYYSLPVNPVAQTSGIIQSSTDQLLLYSTMVHENVPVVNVCKAGGKDGLDEATVSFTLIYKYK